MLIFFFFLILLSILVNTNTMLNLLLTTEFLWITLYLIMLLSGIIYDNLNLTSLTFFLLIFSAIELGIGLILLLLQNLINRTINLNFNDLNLNKFMTRFFSKLYINKINWKI